MLDASGSAFSQFALYFVATVSVALLSIELGYRHARRKLLRAQREGEVEKEAPVGAMVGTTLGLLAFLLAFTFGLAADTFHARKMALLEEVKAIRSTYLLADVVAEPQRAAIRGILRDYVDDRLRWVGAKPDRPGVAEQQRIDALWRQAAIVGLQNPGGVDVFLASVARIIDVRADREMVREHSHIPATYWVVLYLLAILSLGSMGYYCGVAGTRRSPVSVATAIAFSLVIVMIADVDSPGKGFINVSQQPMLDLAASFAAPAR